MKGKTAIVGDGDSITVFKAAGVDAFPAENEKQAREILRKIAREYRAFCRFAAANPFGICNFQCQSSFPF